MHTHSGETEEPGYGNGTSGQAPGAAAGSASPRPAALDPR